MIGRRFRTLHPLALLLAGPMLPQPAAAETVVLQFDRIEDGEVVSEGFRLTRPLQVRIVCEGAGDEDSDEMYAYGWILDDATREVVWQLQRDGTRAKRRDNIAFDAAVRLPAGDYVASYAAYGGWRSRHKILRFLGKEIGRIEIDHDRYKRALRGSQRWGMRIECRSPEDARAFEQLPARRASDGRILAQIIGLQDGAFEERAITLPEPVQVTVYCLGEFDGSDRSMADRGWILDALTRTPVWKMNADNSRHAGGAEKNRLSRETLQLKAGSYVVSYSCDDSHSPGAWNAPPPLDPDYYGITLWANSEAAARSVRPYDEEHDERRVVALIRQADDAYATQGLTLRRPSRLHVYALGERARGGEFADRAWIEEFASQRLIWEMSEHNTSPAGGAEKNRKADEILNLPAGDYVVYYMSDDSHAYRTWNASPPDDPSHWGITLSGVGPQFDASSIRKFVPEERTAAKRNYLVHIVRVRDDANERQRFRLDRPTRVRILSIGEGLGREMFDYGWIENLRGGDVPWEMTMRNTRHAGGAAKNRIYDGVVLLDAGEYEAHYVSDGSHAWGSWNATRPNAPHFWGIRVEPSSASP